MTADPFVRGAAVPPDVLQTIATVALGWLGLSVVIAGVWSLFMTRTRHQERRIGQSTAGGWAESRAEQEAA